MFGKVVETPQNEKHLFILEVPYGVAKVYSHWITKIIGDLIIYLLVMEYYLIMKVH